MGSYGELLMLQADSVVAIKKCTKMIDGFYCRPPLYLPQSRPALALLTGFTLLRQIFSDLTEKLLADSLAVKRGGYPLLSSQTLEELLVSLKLFSPLLTADLAKSDQQFFWQKSEKFLIKVQLTREIPGLLTLLRSLATGLTTSYFFSSAETDWLTQIYQTQKIALTIDRFREIGWQPEALQLYLAACRHQQLYFAADKRRFFTLQQQARRIGAPLNTHMLEMMYYPEPSTTNARQCLRVIFALLAGELNEQGDLKLRRRFDDDLSPHGAFLHLLAQLVQTAFPSGLAVVDDLARQVHQLRYYLDEQLVSYLRRRYPNQPNDRARLLQYDVSCIRQGRSPSAYQPARLHNKRQGENAISAGWNYKRVYNFHAEFILNQQGDFLYLDLWRPVANTVESIVNTASYNYAEKNDQFHYLLDMAYDQPGISYQQKKDPSIRKQALKGIHAPKVGDPLAEKKQRQKYAADLKKLLLK